eukprot:11199800-Lingulodinium_polyedra.AAC.1
MIAIYGGSWHAQVRLQYALATRASTQRCCHMWVRAYVLTPVGDRDVAHDTSGRGRDVAMT